ncbi:peptidase [Microcoleus sp. FACHB-672]|nr:peptidase [Microcoleus sp. FACHB-672]
MVFLATSTVWLVILINITLSAAAPTGSCYGVLGKETAIGAQQCHPQAGLANRILSLEETTSPPAALPPLQTHPLPPSLAQWQDPTGSGDYFSEVKSLPVGYLIWSRFPVKVFIESTASPSSQQWANAVLQAVREWSVYLPLDIVKDSETADIAILHRRPPLRMSPDGNLPRARSAETRYEFYISHEADSRAMLCHRFTILLSPNQAGPYIQAAARHELGHALGLWGHSPLETDTLYFSQVRNPPSISARDINTLKRIYEQPTRLGWSVD